MKPTQSIRVMLVDDHTMVRRGLATFLKVFDDINLRNDAALQLSAQEMPAIVVIHEDVFNKRVAEHEANHQKANPEALLT